MTQEEIIEGNLLIAEFMGFQLQPTAFDDRRIIYVDEHQIIVKSKEYISEGQMLFHSSWDWLIPVCYKWDNLNLKCSVYQNLCDALDNGVTLYEIERVYKQLVENIKWYNKNK